MSKNRLLVEMLLKRPTTRMDCRVTAFTVVASCTVLLLLLIGDGRAFQLRRLSAPVMRGEGDSFAPELIRLKEGLDPVKVTDFGSRGRSNVFLLQGFTHLFSCSEATGSILDPHFCRFGNL
jgi:hypothetical protein